MSKILIKYRQFIRREFVKLALVGMEGASVFLILTMIYRIESYAGIFSVLFTVIAYLVSWMKNQSAKKTFAVAYITFAFFSALYNISNDYYSNVKKTDDTRGVLVSQLSPKTDLACATSSPYTRIECANLQVSEDLKWSKTNAPLLAKIHAIDTASIQIINFEVTVFLKWVLLILIAVAPGFLFLQASLENAEVIEIQEPAFTGLPESFNQFAGTLDKTLGIKKTTYRDWLRRQGWVPASEVKELVSKQTSKIKSENELLRGMLAERNSDANKSVGE